MPENTRKSAPPFQDDSILAGAAQQVMADINRFFSKERLERAAMSDVHCRCFYVSVHVSSPPPKRVPSRLAVSVRVGPPARKSIRR